MMKNHRLCTPGSTLELGGLVCSTHRATSAGGGWSPGQPWQWASTPMETGWWVTHIILLPCERSRQHDAAHVPGLLLWRTGCRPCHRLLALFPDPAVGHQCWEGPRAFPAPVCRHLCSLRPYIPFINSAKWSLPTKTWNQKSFVLGKSGSLCCECNIPNI